MARRHEQRVKKLEEKMLGENHVTLIWDFPIPGYVHVKDGKWLILKELPKTDTPYFVCAWEIGMDPRPGMPDTDMHPGLVY